MARRSANGPAGPLSPAQRPHACDDFADDAAPERQHAGDKDDADHDRDARRNAHEGVVLVPAHSVVDEVRRGDRYTEVANAKDTGVIPAQPKALQLRDVSFRARPGATVQQMIDSGYVTEAFVI